MDPLKTWREKLDKLDESIVTMLDERMNIVDQIGKIKQANHLNLIDPLREDEILKHMQTVSKHPVLKENVAKIFKPIIETSKMAQQLYQSHDMPFRRIGIIGLGLMGGSICQAIKLKDSSIAIDSITHPSNDHSLALEQGLINRIHPSLSDLAQHCELIILASPLSTIIDYAREISHLNNSHHKLLVIDIASVKQEIVQTFQQLSSVNLEFLSTHPMAGREKNGLANSQATLFVDQPWIISPHKNNTLQSIQRIQALILYLGATPLLLEAAIHDRQTCLVSHLPGILSKAYLDFVKSVDEECLNITGPGFKDFTRLAHDNKTLRADIAKFNKKNISQQSNQWHEFLRSQK